MVRRVKHGASKSRLYRIWAGMKERCRNPKCKAYRYYGGRGITVCERWLKSFEDFAADVGEPPEGTSIDRINNDGNYEPGNVRWATMKTQAGNRSNNVTLTAFGETKILADWLLDERCKAPGLTITRRVQKQNWDHQQAIETPANQARSKGTKNAIAKQKRTGVYGLTIAFRQRVSSGKCIHCDSQAKSRGLCPKHYTQFRIHLQSMSKSDAKRFDERCVKAKKILAVEQVRQIKSSNPFREVG
jgi:hypothetical protein